MAFPIQLGDTFSLRCLGAIEGPRFLDGRTANGTVGLAPFNTGQFTGARWELFEDFNDHSFQLKCLGDVEGPRFLDGRTANSTVGLAPETGGVFTGTHWEVVDRSPLPK